MILPDIKNPHGDVRVVIYGAGQIGSACRKFLYDLSYGRDDFWYVVVDKQGVDGDIIGRDLDKILAEEITFDLKTWGATHVIVAMPFAYNEKIATGAAEAGCNYIDFTEDDVMADKVQAIYQNYPTLTCAVKCGLAPGFINYLGHSLVKDITNEGYGGGGTCTDLMISVGALPRNVNGNQAWQNYNLSWSVDGLVNEYIRPCRVRINGQEMEIPALTGREKVIADGVEYEAAFTSGGIGSLVKELKDVKNVAYKTLRYPGHYDYVIQAVGRLHKDFNKIKDEFLKLFPFNKDDVIVVYAEAKGINAKGTYTRNTFSGHFGGGDGLTGIQSTTAGSGVAILEMMLQGKISGIVNHADISLVDFMKTTTAQVAYSNKK